MVKKKISCFDKRVSTLSGTLHFFYILSNTTKHCRNKNFGKTKMQTFCKKYGIRKARVFKCSKYENKTKIAELTHWFLIESLKNHCKERISIFETMVDLVIKIFFYFFTRVLYNFFFEILQFSKKKKDTSTFSTCYMM